MRSLAKDRESTLSTGIGAAALACLLMVLGGNDAIAAYKGFDQGSSSGRGRAIRYVVTITNLTYDQIISDPVVVAHDGRFELLRPGEAASDELAALAEDGMTGPLVGLLQVSPGVFDYAVSDGGVMPRSSVSVEVAVRGRARLISLAGMLVSTNDAFVALDGYALPFGFFGSSGATTVLAPAYDAGSERNTESCDHIPGPPCGNPGQRVTDGAEGFVHIHRGIHGVGDLDASAKDWRNPVARIRIERK